LEVPIPSGLPVKGVILPHQLRTIDSKARNAKKLCKVPPATLQATRSRLKTLLGL
jgi:mRNA-degrading endonuclease toxin of MazEF toxin-antitoxin module